MNDILNTGVMSSFEEWCPHRIRGTVMTDDDNEVAQTVSPFALGAGGLVTLGAVSAGLPLWMAAVAGIVVVVVSAAVMERLVRRIVTQQTEDDHE